MDNLLPPKEYLPAHIGIIMDGNGRWALQRGLQRTEGHKAGAKNFRTIAEYAVDIGIKYLTFYAFSTENWQRSPEEVAAIMSLFREYLNEARDRKSENEQKGIMIRFFGDTSALPGDIADMIETAEQESYDKNNAAVNIAVNYGGRREIIDCVKKIVKQAAAGFIIPEDITEEYISGNLYTAGQPDPDLIIRPSGEQRLSNFLIWQSAYAEFWYSDVLWPDFSAEDLNRAIWDYVRRNRRFGGAEDR